MTRHDYWGIAMLTSVVLAVVTVGAVAMGHNHSKTQLDPETNCPTEGPPPGHIVVIIDATDAWSQGQLEDLKRVLVRKASSLQRYERFSVFEIPVLVPPTLPVPVFSRCSPGKGSDVNPLIEGTRVADRAFKTGFLQPLQVYVDSLRTLHSAPRTPLLEIVQGITRRPDFAQVKGRLEISIVSDMLQNTPRFSQYHRRLSDYAAFASTKFGAEVSPSLRGALVDLHYLIRTSAADSQGPNHLDWWKEYLVANGGRVGNVELIAPDTAVVASRSTTSGQAGGLP